MGSQRRRGDPGAFGLARGGLNRGVLYAGEEKLRLIPHPPARATLPAFSVCCAWPAHCGVVNGVEHC